MLKRAVVILSLCFVCVVSQIQTRILEEGDECFTPSNGNPIWVCELFPNCPVAIRLIKDSKPPPPDFRCGFKGKEPVVCCPPYDISDWSTDEPLSNHETSESGVIYEPFPASRAPTTEKYEHTPPPPPPPLPDPIIMDQSTATTKCEEYRQFYHKQQTDDDSPESRDFHVAVVGGTKAKPKEFLHMGLLGYGTPPRYLCGGSLISERFVLSAAHCENHDRFGLVRTVLLGDLDLNSHIDAAAPRTYFVARRHVHRKYKKTSLYHDIMLLELSEDVQFNSYIKPICLHTLKHIPADEGIVTGWGRIETAGPQSHVLQKVDLPFISREKCNEAFSENVGSPQLKHGIVDDIQLCAGAQENKDSCQGDSGGPLQIPEEDGVYMQVGIVSFGKTICGAAGIPGVYTRVSAYVSWIESIVWP